MRGMTSFIIVSGTLLATGAATVTVGREWTDITGKYRVEADFVANEDGKVRLRKANGKTISVPMEKLSERDQSHVKSLVAGIDERFLRPPGFRSPKGKHFAVTGELMPDELYTRLWFIVKNASNVDADVVKGSQLTEGDYKIMVRLLSDDRIVGNGIYCDAGFGEHGWALSLYGNPAGRNSEMIMRLYANGKGVPVAELEKALGPPRLKKKIGEQEHVFYGNVDLIYDKHGALRGAAFFFN